MGGLPGKLFCENFEAHFLLRVVDAVDELRVELNDCELGAPQ